MGWIVLGAILHVTAIGILLWYIFGRGGSAPEPPPAVATTGHTPAPTPRVTPPVRPPDAGPPRPAGGPLPAQLKPLLRDFETKHAGPVYAVLVLPGGRHLLAGGGDRRLHLWDTATAREVRTFDGTSTGVRSLALNAVGTAAASGGEHGILRLWDVALGREVFALNGHKGPVLGVAFSPNGQYLLSGGADGNARVWDLSSREAVRELRAGQPVTAVAFHPDGRRAVVGGDHGAVIVLDLEAGKPVHTLGGHLGTVHAVALSPDGRQAVSVAEDRTMRFWEVGTGRRVTIRGPNGAGNFTHLRFRQPLRAVAYGGDGSWVVAAGAEPAVTVASVDGRTRASLPLPGGGTVLTLAVAPDASGVYLGTDRGAVRRLDFQGGSGSVAATAGPNAAVPDPAPPAGVPPKWTAEGGNVRSLAVSATGRVVAGGTDRTVRVWEPDGKEANAFPNMTAADQAVAITRDGGTILVGGNAQELVGRVPVGADRLLRTVTLTGTRVFRVGVHLAPITTLALSANGRSALSGSETVVRYWDAGAGRENRQYYGHTGTVRALDFHPKVPQAVSVAADNTARIWDLNGTKLLRTISGLPGTPQGVAFSPDGRTILVYGPGVLGTWDAVTGHHLRSLDTPAAGRRRSRSVTLGGDVAAAWAPNGTIVTAIAGAVALRDAETWDELQQLASPPSFVYAVAVSADGRHVVAGGRGIVAWQLDKPLLP